MPQRQLRKNLDAEVDRLIADPRFSQFTGEFTAQWLALDKFDVLEPDRKRFPKLTRDTRTQLRQEPVQFLEYLMRNNLPVRNLIASDFVMANEVVAHYYGLEYRTAASSSCRSATAAATWAASSRNRRSWPGCRTAASRTR